MKERMRVLVILHDRVGSFSFPAIVEMTRKEVKSIHDIGLGFATVEDFKKITGVDLWEEIDLSPKDYGHIDKVLCIMDRLN